MLFLAVTNDIGFYESGPRSFSHASSLFCPYCYVNAVSSWSPFDLLAVFISSMLFGPILVGDHLYKCSGISTHSIKHLELGLYIFIPSNDPRSLHRTFINSFCLIITTLFSYAQSWHFCYKISMCHSYHITHITFKSK